MARLRRPPAGATRLWLAVAAPVFLSYLLTLSPTCPLEDGGEMIAPACTLGINHPPGYPLYALTGRLVSLVPLGDPAFRLNLLSAVCGAVAAATTAVVAAGLAESRLAGAVAGLALGWTTQLWWQSVIAEKYAASLALHALLALMLAAALAGERNAGRGIPRWAPRLALLYGISASHHGQTIYFAPAVVLALWPLARRLGGRAAPRAAGLLAALLLLGLSVKLVYPPVRAVQDPLFNWNAPKNAHRLAAYLSGSPYQYRILYWSPRVAATRFVTQLADFPVRQFGWPGALLALAGCAWLWRRNRRAWVVWGSVWATGTLYCVNFVLEGIAIQTYYLPVFMIEALWIACGLRAARDLLGRPRRREALLAAAAAGWLGWLVVAHGRGVDRSRHYFAWDFSRALLESTAPRSLLVAFSDYDLFPLWYTHYIRGVRPDVLLANSNFIHKKTGDVPRVQFLYPEGERDLSRRVRFLEDLEQGPPGRPVYISVVYEALSGQLLLPAGAAYRYCWDPAALARADVMAEWRRSRRWMTFRGAFDASVPKDSNTRTMLSYYPYGDYRRAYVLTGQGRHAEALAMYRRALAWPDFYGVGPAASHAGIARELWTWKHDAVGALAEYGKAAALLPEWLPGPRALGALDLELGRLDDAVRVFRDIAVRNPADAQAAADLARVLALRHGKGTKTP